MEEADKRRRPCTKRFRLALWWLTYRLPVLDGVNRETEELARKHCKYSEEAWARDRADFQSQWERIARQAGETVSVVSEARQSSRRLDTARSQRPTFPEISQTSVGGHATKEVPNVLASAARPTGLRTYGRERLNHPTTSTAAIVVIRRCFISLQLSIPFWSCRRVCGGGHSTTLTR
jgi:hypothetical protein